MATVDEARPARGLHQLRVALTRSRGSLGSLFSGRDNGVGAIRLALALAVVVSHSRPLGFGQEDVGFYLTKQQTNLGTMAVYGFFVLSGVLITRSARRVTIVRYAWHRCLRIFPALWVCLLVTALVVAPLVAIHEHGSLAGFWTDPFGSGGPLAYLRANWFTGIRQYGIHDLLQHTTPWGRKTQSSVFDGALWSLGYEMLCYVGIGILAVTGIFKHAKKAVLLLLLITYVRIVADYVHAPGWAGPANAQTWSFTLPLVGGVSGHWITYLGFLFLIGTAVDLYRDRIPIHDGLGLLAAVLLAGSLLRGGFFVIGLPAFAYLLIWLSIRMPKRLHWIGRKNDYSYGIYIYGFIGQQVLASVGGNKWGFFPFVGIAMVLAFAAAFVSWHTVEKHAMRLKGWSVPLPRRRPAVREAHLARPDEAHPYGQTDTEHETVDTPVAAVRQPGADEGAPAPVPSQV